MRICVPATSAEGSKARAYEHFGSAPHFTIFDTTTGCYEVVGNGSQHHEHGTCHPVGRLDGQNVDAVVCAGMGARALRKLNEGGIKVYRTIPGTVEEVIEKFKMGQLEEMMIENACGQHRCH